MGFFYSSKPKLTPSALFILLIIFISSICPIFSFSLLLSIVLICSVKTTESFFSPHFSESISITNDVDVIKQSDKENYQVMVDEIRLGVNLIFQLQNMGEYLRKNMQSKKGADKDIRLAALSVDGKIILPLHDNEKSRIKEKMNNKKRIDLVEQAREGNEEALESLTMDDIDLYQRVSRRVAREDILSVVTSFFMPYGIENDKYEIMGDILDVKSVVNHLTMEELFLECSSLSSEELNNFPFNSESLFS